MPLPPIWEPDAEPLDRTVKLRLSARQLEHLDLAVKEFRMSRSWVLRESLALGFPLFVEKVRQRQRAGLVPRGEALTAAIGTSTTRRFICMKNLHRAMTRSARIFK